MWRTPAHTPCGICQDLPGSSSRVAANTRPLCLGENTTHPTLGRKPSSSGGTCSASLSRAACCTTTDAVLWSSLDWLAQRSWWRWLELCRCWRRLVLMWAWRRSSILLLAGVVQKTQLGAWVARRVQYSMMGGSRGYGWLSTVCSCSLWRCQRQ